MENDIFLAYIQEGDRATINTWAEENVPGAGPDLFSAPLSPSGDEPPTHRLCGWRCADDACKTAIQSHLDTNYSATSDYATVDQANVQSQLTTWGFVALQRDS